MGLLEGLLLLPVGKMLGWWRLEVLPMLLVCLLERMLLMNADVLVD